jgi:hypothetical protein
MVTTSPKSPALLHSQCVNIDTTFEAEPKQPSSATDRINSSKDEMASTDDDFQGFKADNASKVRPEATPNYQAFVNTPHASQTFAYPGFTHTVDQKWTAALLKVMDDINAPDYAFGLIFAWARGASPKGYSFHTQGGLDCARNVTVLVKSIANATQLLPSVLSVSSPHGPPCDVVVFDFVPQLLRLLQNPTLMIPENVVLDFQDPLKPYKSCNCLLGKALSGSVYQNAYSCLITNPSCQLLVPIIQWIDHTFVTGNDRFHSNLTCSHLQYLQNHFDAPFRLGATMDICQKVKRQL